MTSSAAEPIGVHREAISSSEPESSIDDRSTTLGARIKHRAAVAAEHFTERRRALQIAKLRASREAVSAKLHEIPDRMQKLVNQVRLLLDLADDYATGRYRAVSWLSLGVAVVAALFFLSPADVIPDWVPVVGQLDDMAAIAIALKVLKRDLIEYCRFRGLDPAEYF
jgi:uncharacterized membrane protein YkvA (DUF1232 family)